MTKKDINIAYELLVATIDKGGFIGDYDLLEFYENKNKFITFEELMNKVFNTCLDDMKYQKNNNLCSDNDIFIFSFSKFYANTKNDKEHIESSLFYGSFAGGEPFLCVSRELAKEYQSSDSEEQISDIDRLILEDNIIDYEIAQEIGFKWKKDAFNVNMQEIQDFLDFE